MKHPPTGAGSRSNKARPRGPRGRAAVLVAVLSGTMACATNAPSRDNPPRAEPHAQPNVAAHPPSEGPSSVVAAAASTAPTPAPSASASTASVRKLLVHVIPLGPVPEETLKSLVAGLESHADIHARVHPVVPLTSTRKAKRAGRYLAHDMLQVLARAPETGEGKVLGVTEVDIVAEKDGNPEWGVLGLGSIDGKSCVLSTFRMRRAWDHGGADEPTVRSRLWKTAVHEVGHTLGLEHCPTKGCVMEDGHGTVATTDNETNLCPSCAARYKRAIGP